MPAFVDRPNWSSFVSQVDGVTQTWLKIPKQSFFGNGNAVCLTSLNPLTHRFENDADVTPCDLNVAISRCLSGTRSEVARRWDPLILDILIPENHPARRAVFPFGWSGAESIR